MAIERVDVEIDVVFENAVGGVVLVHEGWEFCYEGKGCLEGEGGSWIELGLEVVQFPDVDSFLDLVGVAPQAFAFSFANFDIFPYRLWEAILAGS